MSHYFQDDPNLASNIKTITYEVNGLTIKLFTDNGVFSKGKVDEGSLAFLKVILPLDLGSNILDLGCGYGTLGLTIAVVKKEARVTLADINPRALELCKKNADAYALSQRVTILQSDIYEKIEGKYDSIVDLGTDSYGFAALPGGTFDNGSFSDLGNAAYYWVDYSGDLSSIRCLRYYYYSSSTLQYVPLGEKNGGAVRCVKDLADAK